MWTAEEDRELLALHALHGSDWKAISNGMPKHSDVQCHARGVVICHLRAEDQPTIVIDSNRLQSRNQDVMETTGTPSPEDKLYASSCQPNAVGDFTGSQPKGRKRARPMQNHAPVPKRKVQPKSRAHRSDQYVGHQRNWRVDENRRLIELHCAHGYAWTVISSLFPQRSTQQCYRCWFQNFKPTREQGVWTSDEDFQLLALHTLHGCDWAAISNGFPHQSDEQCRARGIVICQLKNANSPTALTDSNKPERRKCELVGISRSSSPQDKLSCHRESFFDAK